MTAASSIGHKTVVIGNVHGDGDLEVHGKVEGDVTVEGNLFVAAGAEVKGSIAASVVKIAGTVEGNLTASQTLSIDSEARVVGDMITPRVAIAEGAVVRGLLRTDAEQRPRAPAHHQPEQRAPVPAPGPPPAAAPRDLPPAAAPPAPPAPQRSEAEPLSAPRLQPLAPEPKKKGKHRHDRRPPEPRVPSLAKGTKGKKRGDKRSH